LAWMEMFAALSELSAIVKVIKGCSQGQHYCDEFRSIHHDTRNMSTNSSHSESVQYCVMREDIHLRYLSIMSRAAVKIVP